MVMPAHVQSQFKKAGEQHCLVSILSETSKNSSYQSSLATPKIIPKVFTPTTPTLSEADSGNNVKASAKFALSVKKGAVTAIAPFPQRAMHILLETISWEGPSYRRSREYLNADKRYK